MSHISASRKTIVVVIAIAIGFLHFVTGPQYQGPFRGFVNGYLIDILLPFAMYLVLAIGQLPLLRGRVARGVCIFAIGAVSETLQYFGVAIFGHTFDPVDYIMFALGVGLAVIFEMAVLDRFPQGESAEGDSNV